VPTALTGLPELVETREQQVATQAMLTVISKSLADPSRVFGHAIAKQIVENAWWPDLGRIDGRQELDVPDGDSRAPNFRIAQSRRMRRCLVAN
jgi:hypothetical protein